MKYGEEGVLGVGSAGDSTRASSSGGGRGYGYISLSSRLEKDKKGARGRVESRRIGATVGGGRDGEECQDQGDGGDVLGTYGMDAFREELYAQGRSKGHTASR